jgi:protein gp37
MSSKTNIEWTEATWNPVTGCSKVSPGCQHCYAERMAKRLQAMEQPNYSTGFKVATHENMLKRPLEWKKPRLIFVNSMSDLFHKDVPESFIWKVFDVMTAANWHKFQILTKRTHRMLKISKVVDWPDNIWMGVSVETQKYLYRLDHLRQIPTQNKFVSFEPLLQSLGKINLSEIKHVIVGGESGPKARPMAKDWVTEIRDQCPNIPFFFKQWGGPNKKQAGRLLDGELWTQKPLELM